MRHGTVRVTSVCVCVCVCVVCVCVCVCVYMCVHARFALHLPPLFLSLLLHLLSPPPLFPFFPHTLSLSSSFFTLPCPAFRISISFHFLRLVSHFSLFIHFLFHFLFRCFPMPRVPFSAHLCSALIEFAFSPQAFTSPVPLFLVFPCLSLSLSFSVY